MNTNKYKGKNSLFYQKLIKLVLPIAFQQFMLSAISASDALILGLISQDSLSAVSLAGQITFIFNLFMGGLTIGTSILVSQYFGKQDKLSIEKIFSYVTKISIMISTIFFLGTFFIPELLMKIFTNEPLLITGGAKYLRILSISFLFTGISQIYLCIMKNTDYAKKSMLISSSLVILDLILNIVLILGFWFIPQMGIVGAAISTTFTKFLELIWVYFESKRPNRTKLNVKYCFKNDKLLIKDYWKYTLPMLGDYLVWGCGFSMYSVIMGHLGTDAVAANSLANIVKNLIVCFSTGLGNGGGIIVGNELGKGDLKRAKHYGGLLWRLSIISGIISALVLLAISPLILNFSNLTPEANYYLKWMIILCACYTVGKSFNMTVIAGIFPAGGNAKFGLICDAITMWVFAVPIGMLAAFYWKLPVIIVFLIINLDEIIKIPAVIIHYRKYGWVKNLTRENIN